MVPVMLGLAVAKHQPNAGARIWGVRISEKTTYHKLPHPYIVFYVSLTFLTGTRAQRRFPCS